MATNYFTPSQPAQQNMFQAQQFFPQPQGSIYLINNFLEMANVPTGVGISAALCLNEGVMYLKTMQNGQPMVVGYKISPFETEEKEPTNNSNLETRLAALERDIQDLKQKTNHNLNDLIA